MRRSGVAPRRAQPRYPLGVALAGLATVLIVVVSLAVIAVQLLRTEESAPLPASRPTEVAAPGVDAEGWQLPERRWEPLPLPDPQSPLYGAQVTRLNAQPPVELLGCSPPSVVETEEEWRAAVRDQWYCVHRSWVPTLQRFGWSTAMPRVHFFEGEGDDSACGHLVAPAFYCSAGEGSVHFGVRHYDMARTWDLSVNEMVNHEYGHHLQSLAGVTAAKVALPWSVELERRAELQATCWSAALTYRNAAVGFGQAEYDSWQERLETMRADGVHGDRESLVRWGTRGLYAATMNDCNTWVVPGADVS